MNQYVKGYISLLCGIFLFSTIEVASKKIGGGIDPTLLTFIRFFITGVVLLIASIPILKKRERPLNKKDYGIFILNGFVGIAVAISLFHYAINTFDNASSAAVVFCANPIFVVLFAPLINKTKFAISSILVVLVGLLGISFFVMEGGAFQQSSLIATLIMLASAALFGVSVCITKKFVSNYGAMVFMGFSALFASMFLLPIVFIVGPVESWQSFSVSWVPIIYVTLMGTTAAYFLYYYGLSHASLVSGAMTFFLKPIIATILALIFLPNEIINIYTIIGTLFILTAVGIDMCMKFKHVKQVK
ncbi:MAG: DMT family transporter [Kiritimatiellae bacterium]|jgi:drug/metabolite transporter (DMT)-like permease|nr:DMT family transporter [Kiritimatiellia bacterium]